MASSKRTGVVGMVGLGVAAGCGDVTAPREVECGPAPVEVLPNGSFDDATPRWVQQPVSPSLLCGMPNITPADGTQAACLGATDGTTRTLIQTVPLPEGARSVTLAGQICITTADTTTVEHDLLTFDLLEGGGVISAIGKLTNRDGVADCQFRPFELTAPTRDPVSALLRIQSTLDPDMPTSFFLDALSLEVSCTP